MRWLLGSRPINLKFFAATAWLMLLALRQLLWQGGLRVGITVVTALSIAGMLSLVAKYQEPRKPLVAEAAAAKGCLPSHCRPKVKPQ